MTTPIGKIARAQSKFKRASPPGTPLPLGAALFAPSPAAWRSTGAHPWFHDIERLDALRATASRANDPDIARLRALLTDAHERIADFDTTLAECVNASDLEEAQAETEKVREEVEAANDALEKMTDERDAALDERDAALAETREQIDEMTEVIEAGDEAVAKSAEALAESLRVLADTKDALALAEKRAAELSEVEPIAHAFALLFGPTNVSLSAADQAVIDNARRLLGVL